MECNNTVEQMLEKFSKYGKTIVEDCGVEMIVVIFDSKENRDMFLGDNNIIISQGHTFRVTDKYVYGVFIDSTTSYGKVYVSKK